MPYIDPKRRELLAAGHPPENAGELNYLFTVPLRRYWNYHGRRYQAANDIVGALESAKAEFQRRIVAPYEDQKIKENGDVYL